LIDEFGRGTHYVDGLSLFYGFWEYFKLEKTPVLITATNFSELFKNIKLTNDSVLL